MTTLLIQFICAAAVIACGLISGVFLAFSDFVMKSLAAASPSSGVEAMQFINRKVYGSSFLALLMGMALVSVAMAPYAFLHVSGSATHWIIAGGTLYMTGVFIVTMVFNVPMNNRLDIMDHTATKTASYWATYTSSWTRWNHVRTVASAGSAICFLVASIFLASG